MCILQTSVPYRICVEMSNTLLSLSLLFHFVCLFVRFHLIPFFLFISSLQILMPDKEKTKLVATPTEKRKADDIEIKDLKKVSAYKTERQHIMYKRTICSHTTRTSLLLAYTLCDRIWTGASEYSFFFDAFLCSLSFSDIIIHTHTLRYAQPSIQPSTHPPQCIYSHLYTL